MAKDLDLADIQGNILQAYGRQGFPAGRCLLLHVNKGREQQAREALDKLRKEVTTAELWPSSRTQNLRSAYTITAVKPDVTVNIAFTFNGLIALGVPVRTLRGMPDEFQEGMLKRATILRDCFEDGKSIEDLWDPVWTNELREGGEDHQVHVLIVLNAYYNQEKYASPQAALNAKTTYLASLCGKDKGLTLLKGHKGPHGQEETYQDMAVLPSPEKEHFGFTDGIGDPVFEGQYPDDTVMAQAVIGQGKLAADQSWVPLATGEFLLGHADEAQETPGSAMPIAFSRNGTFMAYRKLHQNVQAFHRYIESKAADYAAIHGITQEEANETLRAKMAGRWSDGIPLMHAPTYGEWRAEQALLATLPEDARTKRMDEILKNFSYSSDPDGSRCPFSSHLRRSNPRDMLDPTVNPSAAGQAKQKATSVLNNRRRVLRRGLPYGTSGPNIPDSEEHGVLMMVVCASLFRQFEFLQQQWLQYGLDFQSGNDTCPIVGNHGAASKFVIETTMQSRKPPFICESMPQFVEVRGGAYFFIPSMTALRLITQGLTDPT
jgi:Dyp-type peroxidase family